MKSYLLMSRYQIKREEGHVKAINLQSNSGLSEILK